VSRALRYTPEQLEAYRKRIGKAAGALAEGLDIDRVHRKAKYGNERTATEEGTFDSRKEAKRCRELRLRLKAREIPWLARQVEFILPGGVIYRADFVYPSGEPLTGSGIVVEDVKGVRTPAFRIKARLMAEAGYPVTEL
jgi:hypothetical protein